MEKTGRLMGRVAVTDGATGAVHKVIRTYDRIYLDIAKYISNAKSLWRQSRKSEYSVGRCGKVNDCG